MNRNILLAKPSLLKLVGERCHFHGRVERIRYNNPFTRAQKEHRLKMILLTPVHIEGYAVDHLWVPGFSKNKKWKPGDWVRFTAKLSLYQHNGAVKIGVGNGCKLRPV